MSQLGKKLLSLGATVLWTVLVVTAVIGAIEWGLARAGRAEPEVVWLWDASLLSPTPIFARDGGARTTDVWLTHVDNVPRRFEAKKPPGTYRIFCVGASTTAGWPFQRGSYPEWLGAFAADLQPDRRVEVINAGIHGFDTERVLSVVDEILAYHPDMVILQTGFNDYNSYRLRQSGWRPRFHAWLVMHSRIYNGLLPRIVKPPETAVSRSGKLLEAPEEAKLEENYRAQLERFSRTLKARGVEPVILSLAFTDRYLGDHPMVKKIWPAMNEIVKSVTAAEHAGYVDLSSESARPELMIDSMHSTIEGYRYVAHQVADALCAQKLLPSPCQKLRSDGEYAKAIQVDDPADAARSSLKLAKFYLDRDDDSRADQALRDAASAAPGLVDQWVRDANNPRLLARFAKLRGP
jgi:lysophospholipase L1-like esterase